MTRQSRWLPASLVRTIGVSIPIRYRPMTIDGEHSVRHGESLAELPIDVAEAMYSPDFVEFSTLGAGGTALALPMSFTLDIAANVVRFTSPLNAGRIANLARDPRCCISFSRVTTGHPPVLLQGVATLGEAQEGVRRGPARRFSVTPVRLFVLSEPVSRWQFSSTIPQSESGDSAAPRRSTMAEVRTEDLDALPRFETTVVGLRDSEGWPLNVPVEIRREGDSLVSSLPESISAGLASVPASLLGHTWTKDGPRYLAMTGRASIDGSTLRCHPTRVLRRP
jgi:hypothetical protein